MKRGLRIHPTAMTSGATYVIVTLLTLGADSHPAQSCSLSVVPDKGLVSVLPGSDVTFVCSATCLGPLSRDQLMWRDPHGNFVASFGRERVHTVSYNRWMVSRLMVTSAQPHDSGVYTCQVLHGTRLLQYNAVLQVQDISGSREDPGPRRGDIFIEPEVEFGDIRPVRSVSRQPRRRFPGNGEDRLVERLRGGRRLEQPADPRRDSHTGLGQDLVEKDNDSHTGLGQDLVEKDNDDAEKVQAGADEGTSVPDVQDDVIRKVVRVRRQADMTLTLTSQPASGNSMTASPPVSPPVSPTTIASDAVTSPGSVPAGRQETSSLSLVSSSQENVTLQTGTSSVQTSTVTTPPSRDGVQSTSSARESGTSAVGSTSDSGFTPGSSTGSGSSNAGSESGSSSGSGSTSGSVWPRGQNPNTGISSASQDEDGDNDFGRYGMLAFGLALGAALLLLYALLLVVLVPKCCKRKRRLDLKPSPDQQTSRNRDMESDAIFLAERPHKPLATMTSATGLNGEYITSVDLDVKADGKAGEEGEEKEEEEGKGQDSNPKDTSVSTFLIGRLISSSQTDEETPTDTGSGDSRQQADSCESQQGTADSHQGTADRDSQSMQPGSEGALGEAGEQPTPCGFAKDAGLVPEMSLRVSKEAVAAGTPTPV